MKPTSQQKEQAFVQAYGRNVANASDEDAHSFIHALNADVDPDELHKQFPSDYSSLMDARGMFEDGRAFEHAWLVPALVAALEQLASYTSNELVIANGVVYDMPTLLKLLET